jgi:cytochrome o ubiquinol oxidase subunit 2
VRFDVTADAPMNSFWIPRLGGQIYAMTGMVTNLNLKANAPGLYAGLSANYSGSGFADMKFVADATSPAEFDAWVTQVRSVPHTLTQDSYALLREPSTSTQAGYYGGVSENLFNAIVMRFMNGADLPQHTH